MKVKTKKIFKFTSLILYIALGLVLVVESCINGKNSSQQSNAIGGTLAGFFNDLSGDLSSKIEPTSIDILNKVTTANVGDTLILNHKTLPEDATYTSVVYESSDMNIASVDNNGKIIFKKEGSVTIKVSNKEYPNISDSFSVTINKVSTENISASIQNALFDSKLNSYILETYGSYEILTSFTPSNATNKNIDYSISNDKYLKVQNNIIYPITHSFNEKTILTVSQDSLKSEISIIVRNPVINNTTDFTIKDLELRINESKRPEITFNPSEPTFLDYTLESSSDCINIDENNSITGLKAGKNIEVKFSMPRYGFFETFYVNVLSSPEVERFSVSYSPLLVAGTTSKLYFYNLYPTFASLDSLEISSDDPSIVSIDSTDKTTLHLHNSGETSIHITNKKLTINKEMPIIVHQKDDNPTLFEVEEKINVNKQGTYDIKTLVNLQLNSLNDNLYYFLDNDDFATINGDSITINQLGKAHLFIVHPSGMTKKIEIYSSEDFTISESGNEISSLNIENKESKTVTISDNSNSSQKYKIETPSSVIVNALSNNQFSITVLEEGASTIKFIPYYDNIYFKEEAKTIDITSISSSLSDRNLLIGCNLVDKNENIGMDNPDSFTLTPAYTGYYLKPFAFNKDLEQAFKRQEIIKLSSSELSSLREQEIEMNTINNLDLSITSSNEEIIKIQQFGNKFKLTPTGIGNAVIIIKDNISLSNNEHYQKTISISVYNRVKMEEKAYTIYRNSSGSTIKHTSDNAFEMTNNTSASIKLNFDTIQTTYFNTTFSSSDESIVKVGQDGVLTALKKGKATIKIMCYDGISPKTLFSLSDNKRVFNYYEEAITITVIPKNLITDFNSFFLKIRKGIGHFAAFLVFGIFSTLTYALMFDKKYWKLTFHINFFQGFFFAALTEIIQLFVPGRAGLLSDVFIDMSGFLISAIILTIIIVTREKIIEKKKK